MPTLAIKTFAFSLLTCLLSLCPRVFPCPPFFSFFVFFTTEILFLAPSNGVKKPKAKMKINAKRPTLPQKILFSPLILFPSYANCFSSLKSTHLHEFGRK